MSQTRAQKRKQSKKKSRAKKLLKSRNMERQAAPKKWRLDVFYNEHWTIGFKSFSRWEHVEAFRGETEVLRKKGVEIIAGRVVNLATGKVEMEIEASGKKSDPKDLKTDEPSGPEVAKASGGA